MSSSLAKKQSRGTAQTARRRNKERGLKQLHVAKPLVTGSTFTNGYDAFVAGLLHDLPGSAPVISVTERIDPEDPSQIITSAENVMMANYAEFFSGDPERKLRACETTIDLLCLKLTETLQELHEIQHLAKARVDEGIEIGPKTVDHHLLRSAMFVSGIFRDMLEGRRNITTYFVERQIAKEGGKGVNSFQSGARNALGVAVEVQRLFLERYRSCANNGVEAAASIVLKEATERLHKIGGSIDHILAAKSDRQTKALRTFRTDAMRAPRNYALINDAKATTDSAAHQRVIDILISMAIEEASVDLVDEQKMPQRQSQNGIVRSRNAAGQLLEEPDGDL